MSKLANISAGLSFVGMVIAGWLYIISIVDAKNCEQDDRLSAMLYTLRYDDINDDILYLQDKVDLRLANEADKRELNRKQRKYSRMEEEWTSKAKVFGRCDG